MLSGVNVALGVTGSISAVKCVELAHELRRNGASVRAVTTPATTSILNPWALEFATNNPVVAELTGAVEHVALCGTEGWADVFLIAPATANTIGKIAAAIDDTPVTTCATTAIGANIPVVVAPAMHEPMWNHPGVLDAIDRLKDWNISFVSPRLEEGKAKIASEEDVVTAVATAATEQSLDGCEIVITSGATTESIDPVRTLTNRATGKTGEAIARACAVRGANVTLIHNGPIQSFATVKTVESGAEMREKTLDVARSADVLISAAAISDFSVTTEDEKLDSGESYTLTLTPEPKLLDAARDQCPDLTIVGFKAETGGDDEALISAARSQLERIGAACVVANDASVMGEEAARVIIVDGQSATPIEGSKATIGAHIADTVATIMND